MTVRVAQKYVKIKLTHSQIMVIKSTHELQGTQNFYTKNMWLVCASHPA